MALLKIKKSDLTSKRMQECLKEIRREEKKVLYGRVDESKYHKLMDVLHIERLEYNAWLNKQIDKYLNKHSENPESKKVTLKR